jgi:signal peptidase II
LVLQLGGAIGNLIDRLSQGYVTDFISVGSFAVFNVADACITLGVIILLAGVWYKDRPRRSAQVGITVETPNPPAEEPPFE